MLLIYHNEVYKVAQLQKTKYQVGYVIYSWSDIRFWLVVKSGKNSREIILPKKSSHNAARNTLLKELDKTGAFKNGSNKYIERLDFSYGYGKQKNFFNIIRTILENSSIRVLGQRPQKVDIKKILKGNIKYEM